VMFLEWRKVNNVDNVLWEKDNDPKLRQVFDIWPVYVHKTDKEGLPVLYEKIGPADVKGIFQTYPDQKYWIRNHLLMHEGTNHLIFTEYDSVLDKPYQGILFIEDLRGLGWRHWYTPAISVMKAVSEIDTNYYPNAVRKLYIINAPSIFTWMWKLVKPWLDPFTANSMVVLGSDFYNTLSQEIPPENIPKEYGGLCNCPRECLPLSPLPAYSLAQDNDTTHVIVPRKGTLNALYIVESGCTLKWEFSTNHYDINFGVFYENEDESKTEILATSRYDSHLHPQSGFMKAPLSGTYVLYWDNSYSLLRHKELTYKVTVETTKPED